MEQLEALSHTSGSSGDWEEVRPFLDAAMSNLSELDRDALLLRFFQNRDFRAVGAALGISDDAAQKRVSRGLGRLREELARHGLKATAGSLAIVLSANAIKAAPAGLVAAIASSAIVAGTTAATTASATTTAAKLMIMTTLQKGLVATTVIAALGAAVYQGHQVSVLRLQNQRLKQARAPLAEQIQQLARAHEDSTNRVVGLLAEMERLRRDSAQDSKLRGDLRRALFQLAQLRAGNDVEASPDAAVQDAWSRRADSLKRWFQEHPDKAIPELRLLDEDNWLFTASRNLEVATNDLQKADHNTFAMIASDLRETAKNRFARSLGHALSGFLLANAGVLPNSLQELLPYFSRGDTSLPDGGAPIDDSILQRYQLVKTGPISSLAPDEPIVIEKAPVDPTVDSLLQIKLGTFSYKSVGISDNMSGEPKSWAAPDAFSLTSLLKQPLSPR